MRCTDRPGRWRRLPTFDRSGNRVDGTGVTTTDSLLFESDDERATLTTDMSSDEIEETVERVRAASKRDDLDGKVAIVTGAGTRGGEGVGNGAATAILLARQGATVTLVDKEPEYMEITERVIEEEGGDYLSLEGDVTDPDDCRRIVEETVSQFGSLHVLHNNVGGGAPRESVEKASSDTWEASLSINLMSAVSMSKYAVPHIRDSGGGSIINVSSTTALRPKRDGSSVPYTTTKSAMMGLTRAMARDHGDDRIRVNCLLPGLIWTPGIARHLADEREKRKESTPYAREGSPWDVGWTAVFLASDRSRFITGAAIPVDGGLLLTAANH